RATRCLRTGLHQKSSDRASPPRSYDLPQLQKCGKSVPRRLRCVQLACHAGLWNWPEQKMLLLTRAESPCGNRAPPQWALLCLRIVETDTLEHHGVNATQDELRLPLRAHIRSQQPEEI